MNITVSRMRPTVNTLRGIREQLERIADSMEMYLSYVHNVNVRPPHADTSGPAPQAIYTDELQILVNEMREQEARMGSLGRDLPKEE